MGHDVQKAQAATQKVSAASSTERSTSEKVAIEITGILQQFWRDAEDPDEVRAVEMRGWLDVLEGCALKEIRLAWADYQKTGPRSGRGVLYRPDAGAIHSRIMKERRDAALYVASQKPRVMIEERREPASAEARARILKEVYADRTDGEVAFVPKKIP